jgi:hypothetical protein
VMTLPAPQISRIRGTSAAIVAVMFTTSLPTRRSLW